MKGESVLAGSADGVAGTDVVDGVGECSLVFPPLAKLGMDQLPLPSTLRIVWLTFALLIAAGTISPPAHHRSRPVPQSAHVELGSVEPEYVGSMRRVPSTIAVETLRRDRKPSPGARSSRIAGSESSSTHRLTNGCERCADSGRCAERSAAGVGGVDGVGGDAGRAAEPKPRLVIDDDEAYGWCW